MTIHKAKASAYNEVTTAAVYDYMRQYLAEISRMIEPEEGGGLKCTHSKPIGKLTLLLMAYMPIAQAHIERVKRL